VSAAKSQVATIKDEIASAKCNSKNLDAAIDKLTVELQEATTSADAAKLNLSEVQEQSKVLEDNLKEQSSLRDAAEKSEIKMEQDRNRQRLAAWKWRVISFGLVVLIAGFFVVRQYLPILKLI